MTEPILSVRQRAALAAICGTLVPSVARPDDPHGFFAASSEGTDLVARVERLIGMLADPLDRLRLRLLLSALGTFGGNLFTSGRLESLQAMDVATRESVLRGWADSGIQLRRAGFQALKRLVHVGYYAWPTDGRSHPAWRHVGYPGPLPPPETGFTPLPTLPVERDTTLDCDVVVVGSGAGGGVVAGLLAEAGRSVVVLEKGENPTPAGFTQVEGDMLNAFYLDAGLMMTQSGSLPILAGSALGGGTVINYTTSFPLPEPTRAEWARRSGLGLFTSPAFEASFRRVSERIGVTTVFSDPAPRDLILERGCRALGWHVDVIPRNVRKCKQGLECGYCGYGCRHGAKGSTAATYLTDAARAGARLIVRCEADRVLIEAGRATGVVGRVRKADGTVVNLTVRARAVVVACGSIYTPAVLSRSGVSNPNVGRGLRLHPATAIAGIFPERVEPWTGSIQTRYSDRFADQHDGYGVKFETAPMHFALPASAFGWEGAARYKEDLAKLGNLSIVGVLLRDRDPGHVATSRGGRPRVHYEISPFDIEHLRQGLRGAAELLAAAGATEAFTVQQPPARCRPGGPGWLERFGTEMDARGYARCRMSFITFHQMASCAMGAAPATSVVGETGESHDVKGLYVADASTFPASSGVNPMLTIMAIADHVAGAMIQSW
jgi:choline dehydrogenase-like flavoprotein